MKPAPFAYYAPKSLDECLALLNEFSDDSALLAGGQSLVPLLRFRLARPSVVISIRNIGEEASTIRVSNDSIFIGASVTYSTVQRSPEILAACPLLPKAIELIATPAVRSRGTVCGNLCQADPASELPALAVLFGARFHLQSLKERRVVAAEDFFCGPYMTARRGDEILTKVEFPIRPKAELSVINEITRLRGGFPLAGIVVAVTRGDNAKLSSALVACFGVNAKQVRVRKAEEALKAEGYTAGVVDAAADAINEAIEPHSDVFASAEYRRSCVRTLLRRSLDQAWQEGGRSK